MAFNTSGVNTSDRDYYDRRLSQMKLEYESFEAHYKELSEFISPRRGRFFIQDRNKGTKKYNNIINSKATTALRTARAGMFAGTMSPARPWFNLQHPDEDLMEFQTVKIWLDQVEKIIRRIFNESNLYAQAPVMIGEMAQFGTGLMFNMDDFNDVSRFYASTVGSYYIDQNERFEVDTVFRQFEWTTLQIVGAFGLENVSTSVETSYDNGDYSTWFPVNHIIEPNDEHRPSSRLSRDKAFRSTYYEPNSSTRDPDEFLSVQGFDIFPAYAPRWDVTTEDIYGTDCPGMTALGDIKGLQIEEKRKAQGIDKLVNPPLKGPASVKQQPVNSLPGGLTIYDGDDSRQRLEPIYQVNPQLQELRLDINAVEQRIDEAFYVDMFLAISNIEGIQPRNELDLIQRNEERLLMLGPVLQRIHDEFLGKLVEDTFIRAVNVGILPPAPQELQGQQLQVKFVSTLAMAQEAVATNNIERVFTFAGTLAANGWTQALDKVDPDQAIDEFALAIGAPPKITIPDDVVAAKRQAAAQAQQQAALLEAAASGADTAKTLGEANTGGANALADLVG